MRTPKPAWVAALKAQCGQDHDLRWNEVVGRWEFLIPCVDGVVRSQFYCWQTDPHTGAKLEPDPHGYLPFRELDDEGMRQVLRNLEQSFLGNPHDGSPTVRQHLAKRQRFNDALDVQKRKASANLFADMVWDRKNRLQGNPQVSVPIEVVSVLGGPKT